MQMSKMFLSKIFWEFLALTDPISRIAKPACMKNTNAPDLRIQIESIDTSMSCKVESIISCVTSVLEVKCSN